MASNRFDWYPSENINELESNLYLGDRLEFSLMRDFGFSEIWRTGIYVGRYIDMEHAVIYMLESQRREIRAKEISVIMEEGCVVGNSCWVRINNSRDPVVKPLPPDFIIKIAKIMHQGGAPMVDTFLNSNRERFENLCQYDIDWSNRVFAQYSFGRLSCLYTSANIKDLEDEVCPGDRLEFPREAGPYAHWGIYVGPYQDKRHCVIHFGGTASGSASSLSNQSEIRADTIGTIIGRDNVRINNSRDHDKQPLSPYLISGKAKKMHQDNPPIGYNLILENCEHFVNRCRYAESYSEQAFQGIFIGVVIVVAFVLVVILRPNIQGR